MKIDLNANEQILIAALINSEISDIRQEVLVDEDLVNLYTNLRTKIIK